MHPPEPAPQDAPKNTGEDRAIPTALRQLWIKFQPEMQRRVTSIESAAEALVTGSLTAQQREAAEQAAHKLAGSLGTFGFAHGTEIARQLESSFAPAASPDPAELRALAQSLRAIVGDPSALPSQR